MIFWIFYFLVVVYLQISQMINVSTFLNLALCIFIFFPISSSWPHGKVVRIIRNILGYAFGIMLLWHESYLPPVQTLWNFFVRPELRPSMKFVTDFISSHFDVKFFAIALLLIPIVYVLTYTKTRKYSAVFFIACLVILFFDQKVVIRRDLSRDFFLHESGRLVEMSQSPQNKFDVVFLQICSWSWADLEYIHFNTHPLFGQFDYIFTNFNSATSYSDPAALRLLQANCGQKTEGEIFSEVPEKCYLFDNLKKLGYSTYTAMNHDGTYSDFKDKIHQFGKADLPIGIDNLKPVELSFDDSAIYRDGEVLDNWLELRKGNFDKAALYYNSVTLHTGGSYIDKPKVTEDEQYAFAFNNLATDLDDFIGKIKKTNRNTILVLLGEHGAALQGSSVEYATVRDVPLPSITQVPVAIKLFGPNFNKQDNGQDVTIDSSTSYLALVQLLSNLLEKNPIDRTDLQDAKITQDLPSTDFVSETGTGLIVQNSSGLFYRSKNDSVWNKLSDSLIVKPADDPVK